MDFDYSFTGFTGLQKLFTEIYIKSYALTKKYSVFAMYTEIFRDFQRFI